jgi:hypothetical protein
MWLRHPALTKTPKMVQKITLSELKPFNPNKKTPSILQQFIL